MATWKIKTPDTSLVFRLAEEFKTSEIIGRVLANRNIESLESSRSFFDPNLSQLHDPFLMKDMDIAAGMVAEKVKSGGRIFIFGDYDVDGTTGSSALFLFLTSLECDAKVYIPDRMKEGYGLSREGIDVAKDWGADLLISCDCGIIATDEVAYANDQNLEVIITDHHMPDENLPEANAILNPKQPDCSYPFKGLCGGAVVFKLIQAVSLLLELDDDLVHQYIDLITLGTAADIVPLTDENRIIVKHGLKSLSKTKRPGLRALLEVSGLGEKELTVGRLLFWAAPRINAAGRLGDANRAVQLMTTEN